MKRNKQTIRVAHRQARRKGRSRYAEKRAAGNQMYGPGCCAHTRKSTVWDGGRDNER